jgi:hypothetical protein
MCTVLLLPGGYHCVLYCCHGVSTQLQLINISISISEVRIRRSNCSEKLMACSKKVRVHPRVGLEGPEGGVEV